MQKKCLRKNEANVGFPGDSDGKESACKAGDMGLIPGLGRSPRGGNGNQLQYSCLGNPMGRGAWWATVYRVTKESDMTSQLNNKSERGKQIPYINTQYCIYMGSGKILLTNLFARLKQRHRCQEQTCRHGGKEWGCKLGE